MTRRRGFTLVEALVAMVLGALVLALAASGSVAARRLTAALEARGTASQRATAVPTLLGGALTLAGRGLDGCGLQVDGGGARLRMLGFESADTAASTLVEVFADLDGGGRPALYRRTPPFARQPWLEEVVAFEVAMGRDVDGAWRGVEHDDRTRWTALRVELAWSDGDRRRYDLPLPQAPCAGVLP